MRTYKREVTAGEMTPKMLIEWCGKLLDSSDHVCRNDAFGFYVALRPRRRDDLLGTGTEWEGDRVIGSTAETARKRPERP